MDDTFKHEYILEVVKSSRQVLDSILTHPSKEKQQMLALIFVALLQQLEDVTIELVATEDPENLKAKLSILDGAIQKLQIDADQLTSILSGNFPPFNPNTKGEA